ncbi:MAG TPA: acyl-protein synthase [Elusimicrobiota bacterium]|nr:acyl-protein synthase [Elusimicrobiota bacterium]
MKSDEEPLRVPDPAKLAAVQRLCELSDPFAHGAEADALYVKAMLESSAWHRERSDFYSKHCVANAFLPSKIKSVADCAQIPFVLANFFKTHEVLSIDKKDVFAHFTSSGTTGQKSQVFFDRWSMKAGQRMLDGIFARNGWATPSTKTNYLLYSYETEPDSKLGTAYTDNYLRKFAPAQGVFVALRRTGTGGHDFDVFGCIAALQRYEKEGLPVRIFGFPAFLYFTLKRMRDLGFPTLKLSPESLVFLGGGWKGNADQAIAKSELYARVNAQLGIPDARLRDGFGSVEHPIPYVECARHQFHVPVWSRVFIRDVKTLAVLGFGERGFLHFTSPYITSMPAHSVLMGDLASLHPGSECGCGIAAPYFVVHGRAGTSKNKSCAIAAAEMLAR